MKIVIHYTKNGIAAACAIILLLLGTVVTLVVRNRNTAPPQQRIATSLKNTPPQQIDEGPVDITVKHDAQQSTATTHQFTITLDTHSGDLSTFDGQANIVYRPADGNETRPATIGGDREVHHRTIIATFTNTTVPGTITIQNLRGIAERTFPITL